MIYTQYHLPDYLREGYAAIVKNGCELLRLAGQEVTAVTLTELIRTAPRDPNDLLRDDFTQKSYCYQLLRSVPNGERRYFLSEYFLRHLPALHRGARTMMEEAIFGILITFEEQTRAPAIPEKAPESEEPRLAFACEACGREYQVSSDLQGKRAKCKECSHEMTVPTQEPPAVETKTIACEGCGTALNLAPGSEGRRVKCCKCGHKMGVPAEASKSAE